MLKFGTVDIRNIATDAVISIGIDSAMARKIKIDQPKIMEVALVSAGYDILLGEVLIIKIASLVADPIVVDALAKVFGKSLLTVIWRMLTKKQYTIGGILQQWALIQLGEMLFNRLVGEVFVPANGRRQV